MWGKEILLSSPVYHALAGGNKALGANWFDLVLVDKNKGFRVSHRTGVLESVKFFNLFRYG